MGRYPFLKYLEVGSASVRACLLAYLLLMIFMLGKVAFLVYEEV